MHDPVLDHTSWTPIARGGHAWPTHHLFINEAEGRAELRPNLPQRKTWIILCELIGIMFMIWLVTSDAHALISESQKPGLAMLTIALIALPIFSLTLRSVVFDLPSGRFWEQGLDWSARPRHGLEGRIEGIHAIQLIPERIIDNTSRTRLLISYELNLVNHRGGRLNLADHGFLNWIRKDAKNLANFLDVPLWDATPDSEANMTDLKFEVMSRYL